MGEQVGHRGLVGFSHRAEQQGEALIRRPKSGQYGFRTLQR